MNRGLCVKILNRFFLILSLLFCFSCNANAVQPLITDIVITGNKQICTEAIRNRLPYKKGDLFDAKKSGLALHHLYSLGFFKQIRLEQEKGDNDTMILHVIVNEKKLLEQVTFSGNTIFNKQEFHEKLRLDTLQTIDRDQLHRLIRAIKNLYKDKNYHLTMVKPKVTVNAKACDRVQMHFTIKEGPKSMIKRIFFIGNEHIPARKLSSIIFTREQWLLGFLSDAGKYNEEHFELDKHRIEMFYRNNGYLMARVTKADTQFAKNKKEINVTFEVHEGPLFKVGTIRALGDEFFSEVELLKHVNIISGQRYNQEKIVKSIERLKALWGDKGYIYADVYPQTKPDEEKRTVDITFHTERGPKMYVNRINITGNKLTRDKVIRREITFEEGDMLTSSKLRESKANADYLGYFERDGVNWKIHRITDELADLEMNVRETKTGKGSFGLTYGTTKNEATRTLKGMLQIEKKNLFGLGIDGMLMIKGDRRKFRNFAFQLFDPYLLDSNISAGLDLYIKHEDYEQWSSLDRVPKEHVFGGSSRLGFMLPSIDKQLQFFLEFGSERIDFVKSRAIKKKRSQNPLYPVFQARGASSAFLQPIVNRTFQEGSLTWLCATFVKDNRNHRVYPNRGYRIMWTNKVVPPLFIGNDFSMLKSECEASWYTPLIGIDDLVLALHGRAGIVRDLKTNENIPYRELFHMGGQNTVRGFVWGSIGPAFGSNPIGGRNMVQCNLELVFPLLNDYSMKAHLFYDAGAGWSTPKKDLSNVEKQFITRDKFNLRHAIGFGINMVYPQPVKIDFGYKLDRNRELGEAPYEWHISMNTAW